MSRSGDLAHFKTFAATGDRAIRNELIENNMGLAIHIAQRYERAGGGDDVRQVALVGLVKAVDRFDPEHGAAFSSFAGRTIEGEIKRYFRDKTWTLRVPRRAKELHLLVRRGTDELSSQLNRSPTVEELANHLQLDRDEVLRGMSATAASRVDTIDTHHGNDDAAPMSHRIELADDKEMYRRVIDRAVVDGLLEGLPEREQDIVRLRFYGELSQSDIADQIGVSQMHVSRLLRRSLEQMRAQLETDSPNL